MSSVIEDDMICEECGAECSELLSRHHMEKELRVEWICHDCFEDTHGETWDEYALDSVIETDKEESDKGDK